MNTVTRLTEAAQEKHESGVTEAAGPGRHPRVWEAIPEGNPPFDHLFLCSDFQGSFFRPVESLSWQGRVGLPERKIMALSLALLSHRAIKIFQGACLLWELPPEK